MIPDYFTKIKERVTAPQKGGYFQALSDRINGVVKPLEQAVETPPDIGMPLDEFKTEVQSLKDKGYTIDKLNAAIEGLTQITDKKQAKMIVSDLYAPKKPIPENIKKFAESATEAGKDIANFGPIERGASFLAGKAGASPKVAGLIGLGAALATPLPGGKAGKAEEAIKGLGGLAKKVIGKELQPLAKEILYHGTSKQSAAQIKAAGGFTPETAKGIKDLTGFDVPPDRPISLTLDKKTAELYSGIRPEGGTGELLAFKGKNLKIADEATANKFGRDVNKLRKAGYDGYHTSSPHDEMVETIVFNKEKLELVNPLFEEARKYKSAEEFVKNTDLSIKEKPEVLFRGFSRSNVQAQQLLEGKHFSDDLRIAEEFADWGKHQEQKMVTAYKLSPNAKIADLDKVKRFLTQKKILANKETLTKAIKDAGYDGAVGTLPGKGNEFIMVNERMLKEIQNKPFTALTPKELTDIWNKAKGEMK